MTRHKGTLESLFRSLNAKSKEAAIIGLYKARTQIHHSQYSKLIQAFQRAAPKHRHLVPLKLREFKELYWLPSAPVVDLARELAWAEVWLAPAAQRLGAHASRVAQAEDLLNVGDVHGISALCTQSIEADGWSFWAASLQIAAGTAAGTGKEIAEALEAAGSGRPSGLIARILRDRNDPAVSYGSFEARCKEFLKRSAVSERRGLYRFRALAELDDESDLLSVLAADAASSFIDYYESLIAAAVHALVDSENEAMVKRLLHLFSVLESVGLHDTRISRLQSHFASARTFSPNVTESGGKTLAQRCADIGSTAPTSHVGWLDQIHRRVTNVEECGIRASDDIDELFRMAANLQSLPTGRALWAKTIQAFLPCAGSPLAVSGFEAAIDEPSAYSLLSHEDPEVETAIRCSRDSRARELCEALDQVRLPTVKPDPFDLWLVRALIARRQFSDAEKLIGDLAAAGGVWGRYAKRFSVLVAFESGNLQRAFEEAAGLLAADGRWAHELPLSSLYSTAAPRQLSALPSWAAATVAHHANQLAPSSKLRVNCRIACRRMYKEMHAAGIEVYLSALSSEHRSNVCAFLADGWTDENLSMVEDMSTSQEVRRERIAVFQALITTDPERADKYRELIQALTLDETLWAGLRLIDSNRIFVNEPGITRWAERELSQEFERWRTIRLSSGGVDLRADQMLRSYLVDKDIEALLQSATVEEQSESGVVLLGVVSRLFSRFLLDPAHGLNSYLSLRVRHGTLRGTLLGPIEDERLLLSGEYSEVEFDVRWGQMLALTADEKTLLKAKLSEFGRRLDHFASWLVNEKVQVSGAAKPQGLFPSRIPPTLGASVLGLTDPTISFGFFLNQCYLAFWDMLAPFRAELARFFRHEVDAKLQSEFIALIVDLESAFDEAHVRSVVTALRALATRTTESCRVIASWFVPENAEDAESYSVAAAIAIAKKATTNVYRGFQSELDVEQEEAIDVSLSTSALSILYDALYVILANAWVHSGLSEELGAIKIKVRFNRAGQVLTIRAENRLSSLRLAALKGGELDALRGRYLHEVPMELVPIEGGSGFAKLARIASAVDRGAVDMPLDFGITADRAFYVELAIKLYARDGVFDAYL